MRILRQLFLSVIVLIGAVQVATAEPHRVLLLHSFGPHFPPWNTITTKFREELRKQSPHPLDLYEASLQDERFGDAEYEPTFVDYLQGLFAKRDLNLVVAVGAPAARFFLRNRSALFPTVPLIIAGANVRALGDVALTSNDTIVSLEFDQSWLIEGILRILPETTDIAVAIGNSPLEKFWAKDLRSSFERFSGRVTFHWWNELSFEEMMRSARELPPRSAIYYGTVRVDAHGEPQEEDRVFQRLREIAQVPLFSYIDSHFGEGIVGGPLLSSQQVARESAAIAVRVLAGGPPGSIKTPPIGLSTPRYDWRELQRWGISESNLPPGSAVYFREATIWQKYRIEIMAICAAILLQAALISWLIYEHRRRHMAEVLARGQMSELQRMDRLATAAELSASIAHEVNQPLTGISTLASAALHWLTRGKPDPEKMRAALTQILEASHSASELVTSVRAMFTKEQAKREPLDINLKIRSVLGVLAVEMQKDRIEVRLQLDPSLPHVDGDRVQIQQVLVNLVKNAIEAMHGEQTRVLCIRTSLAQPDVVNVSVQDTGCGMDDAIRDQVFRPLVTSKANGMGMGLAICHSIITSHKGRIWASAALNKGTIFQFELAAHAARHTRDALAAQNPSVALLES